MEAVAVWSKELISLDSLSGLLRSHWQVGRLDNETLVVNSNEKQTVWIAQERNLWLAPQDRERFSGRFCLAIAYNNLRLVKGVLRVVANSADVLVDNDFGTVLGGDEFVRMLDKNPEWDWRGDLAGPAARPQLP